MTLALQRHLDRQADGVQAFLDRAIASSAPALDQVISDDVVPHYVAMDLLRRLREAGELTEQGWCSEARSAYQTLLQQRSGKRLDRLTVHERPREKALQGGLERLSDAEVLALLLRTGSGDEGVLEFATRLLDTHDGLIGLAGCEIDELLTTAGLGPAKVSELVAAFEIARRLAWARRRRRPTLVKPEDVVALIRDDLSPLIHEEFWCLPLDARSRLIGEPRQISRGDIDGTDAGARAFFRTALKANAATTLAVHNHPTGLANPSAADRTVTRSLVAAGCTIGVQLVDHLIIGDGGRFTSLRREEPGLFT